MIRIVSIGECMVEMAPTGDTGTYLMGFAGDTMNTAWYLRRLLDARDQVDYLTAVGDDSVSDQMVAFLDEAGLGMDHIIRRSKRTVGLYMIQLSDGERSFSYWRGQSAARTLAQDQDHLMQALMGADIAYFSGITLAILTEEDRRRLLDALRSFRAKGGEAVFDTNLRPALWDSPAQMTKAVMEAAAISDTVLPSHDDEATWFGDTDLAATARRYADTGAKTVVVKNGSGPMHAWQQGKTVDVTPAPVDRVVDSTAAGDSFNAGFLAAQIAGRSLDQSLQAGAQLAAKVVSHRGALVRDLD